MIKNKTSNAIRQLLEEKVKRSYQKPAIASPQRAFLSYGQLLRQADYVAEKLSEAGVKERERVAVMISSGPEMAVALFTVSAYTATAPLNPDISRRELETLILKFRIRALIFQKGDALPLTDEINDIAQKHRIILIELLPEKESPAGVFELNLKKRSFKKTTGKTFSNRNIAFVLSTSGTTAEPKIVPLSYENILASARNMGSALKLSSDDKCLNVMPLFHVHGLMVAFVTLFFGGCVSVTPKFTRNKFFTWLAEFNPTWYTASPTIHKAILGEAKKNQKILKKCQLRFIRSSSAPLSFDTMKQLEHIFRAPVAESYGMTEAALQITSNLLPPKKRKPGSAGKAMGVEIGIIDKRKSFLEKGKIGEIVIRGESIVRGYENNNSANKDSFFNGWFRTGDLGRLDKEGYLFIEGRIKEIINKGGEKISPREIDEAIMKHPQIKLAVAFSMPHPSLGEDIGAAIILNKKSSISEEQIKDFLKKIISDFKIPSRIFIVDEIFKGPTGKIQRIGLYEKIKPLFIEKKVLPKNQIEKEITKIWQSVFKNKNIAVDDNFFEIGGDSLEVIELINKIKKLGYKITSNMLRRSPTILGLTRLIKDC